MIKGELHLETETVILSLPLFVTLVLVLTRAAPALQYHFILFVCFFSWGCCLQLRNFSVMLLRNCGSVLWFFSNFGSQNTKSVQNVALGSAWNVFFFCCVV